MADEIRHGAPRGIEDEPANVLAILRDARDLFKTKNAEYQDNYKRFGESFLALFPGRVLPPVVTAQEMDRMQVLIQLHTKMTRYAFSFAEGGHLDSAKDMIVYSAMLTEFTK